MKKIITILCLVTFILAVLPFNINNNINNTVLAAKSVDELKKELEDIQKKKEELRKQMAQKQGQKEDILAEKQKLDAQISDISDDVDKIDDVINQKQEIILQNEMQINKINDKVSVKNGILKERLRIMYEKGSDNYLDVILDSKGVSDMITRICVVQELVKYDKSIIQSLLDDKNQIMEAKKVMVAQQNEKQQAKDMLTTKERQLEQNRAERKKAMDKINSDVQLLEKAEEQEKKYIEEVQGQIKSLLQTAPNANVKYSGGTFAWPVPASSRITSPFGNRLHPTKGRIIMHNGIDVGVGEGSEILAAADGVVMLATYNGGYGNCVVLSHGSGITTLYGHNSKLLVSDGDTVKKGQVISKAGSTGVSTGPHLHFEVSINGEPVNPMNYFK